MSRPKTRPLASVVLTERALTDLRAIESFSIREWGRKTAAKYLDAIALALDGLQSNPEILRLEPEIAPDLFFYRVKKHFLVCDFHQTTVTVLTVIHTSMDLPARLLELQPQLNVEAEILRNKLRRTPGES